ncbi:hypothetical protein LBMAG46_42910 [Planctomycetia bacterium]|jgi:hypothetical protein|nr:hypothetical protein LBMAG46_42910 [Planctomycetia bacterium]
MKTHVLRGSKQEIAERLARIGGEIVEAIVFEDEVTLVPPDTAAHHPGDIFAEMSQLMVDVPSVDDSREAIYTRIEGE